MRIEIETIDAERAKELLKLNTGNFRKIDKRIVRAYAADLRQGKWELNGESIKVNGSKLIDGQHRLHAVLASRVPMKTVVAYDCDSEGMFVDKGRPRTVQQWLEHKGCKNGAGITALSRLVLMHRKGFWDRLRADVDKLRDHHLIDFWEANKERLQDAYRFAYPCKGILPISLAATLVYEGTKELDDFRCSSTATWFVNTVATGEGLDADDAVLHLRNQMLADKAATKTKMNTLVKRAIATLAWNRTVSGAPTSAHGLRFRLTGPKKQPLPKLIAHVQDDAEGAD